MAKIPDGWIAITHVDRKRLKIDIETKELVMCKNCKHRDPEDFKCDHHWHSYSPLPVDDDFWCAYGEKYK